MQRGRREWHAQRAAPRSYIKKKKAIHHTTPRCREPRAAARRRRIVRALRDNAAPAQNPIKIRVRQRPHDDGGRTADGQRQAVTLFDRAKHPIRRKVKRKSTRRHDHKTCRVLLVRPGHLDGVLEHLHHVGAVGGGHEEERHLRARTQQEQREGGGRGRGGGRTRTRTRRRRREGHACHFVPRRRVAHPAKIFSTHTAPGTILSQCSFRPLCALACRHKSSADPSAAAACRRHAGRL